MQAKPRSFGAKQRDTLRQAVATAAGVPKIKVCRSERHWLPRPRRTLAVSALPVGSPIDCRIPHCTTASSSI